MNSFLLALTAVLIVVLSALFAAPLVVDWNAYRPAFETQASKLLGRQVKVGGQVHLVLLPAPELRFDDVKVADSHGGFSEPFLEASSIEAWLNIGALLQGTLEARKITIADPVLRLAMRDDGTGNWQDVGRPGEVLPFAPRDVLLDEVTVSNGRIELVRPGKDPLVMHDVQGVASAASLSGPYKLRASYRFADRPQEVRFSTSAADGTGKFRAKAVMRDIDPGITYLIEGDVTGLNAKPVYDGSIVIRGARDGNAEMAQATPPAERFVEEDSSAVPELAAIVGNQPPQLSAWELKGELKATTERAELPSFELAIHNKGRSQMLKGRLALLFGERPKADGALQARWLDADALLSEGNEGQLTTLGALNAISGALLEQAAELGSASVSLTFEQVSLGGDLLGGVELGLSSADGTVNVERLQASLPGDNRLEASGRLTAKEQGPTFEGPVTLSGSKLRTFIRWAAGDRDLSGQASVGAFSLSANAQAGGGNVELKDAAGEVSGTKFSGSLRYLGGEQRVIDLTLVSDHLDLREVLGEDFSWASWLPASAAKPEQAAPSGKTLFGSLKDDEVRAEFRIGELLLPNIPQGKLDARFTVAKDTLNLGGLDFASPGALTLTGKGRIDRLSETPTGHVDFSLRAVNAESLRAAAAILGFVNDEAQSKKIAALAPLDITGGISSVPYNGGTEASAQITGTAGGSAVSIKARMKGEVAKLAEASINLEGSVEGDRPQALLGVAFPAIAQAQLTRVGAGSGKLTFKVDGVPADRLAGTADISTASLQARFNGEGSAKADGFALTGRLTTKSDNAAIPLLILGLHTSPSAAQVPLEIETEIVKAGPRIDLKGLTGMIAGDAFEAEGYFDIGGEKTRFGFEGKAASASLPALLGSLVEWERAPGAENLLGSITQGASEVWPARSFALDPLTTSEGEIKLKADRVSIGEPFAIEAAEIMVRVDQEGLALSELKGTLFGGTLTASGRLSPRGAGAELKTHIGLEAARLELISQALAGSVLAEGPFSLFLDLSGEGLSPPGIVAGLSGDGKLVLAPGSLQRLSTKPLQRVAAEAARLRKAGLDKEQIAARAKDLRDALMQGTYPYAAAELPLKVQNGTLRFEPAPLVNQSAETTVNGFVELASLKVDSEWVMRLNGQNEDVPPVSLVFAGPLTNVATISPTVDTAPIESFLTMRRMQDDVERLERLDVTGRRKSEAEPQPMPDGLSSPAPDSDASKAQSAAPMPPSETAAPAPAGAQTPAPTPLSETAPAPANPEGAGAAGRASAPNGAAPSGQAAATPAPATPGSDQLPWLEQGGSAQGATAATVGPDAASASPAPPSKPRPARRAPTPDDWKKGVFGFGG